METQRIDLPSGGYIECFKEMKHRTVRLIGAEVRKYFSSPKVIIPHDGGATKIAGEVDVDFSKIDFTAVADITILNLVVEWSFGDTVNREVLDDLSEREHAEIMNPLDAMYGSPLAAALGLDLQKDSSER